MNYKYRPILKTKAGEVVALGQLSNSQKGRLFPIFQIGENPPPTFAQKMATHWHARGAGIDGLYNYNFTGHTGAFDATFSALANSGIPVIPSADINSPGPYLASALAKVGTAAPGLVLRSNLASLPNAGGFASFHGLHPGAVDLVIEMGHIAEFNPGTLAGYVSVALNSHIAAGLWRSVTLSGSSAPKDFGGLAYGTNIIPRQEWLLWNTLAHPPGQPIDYSDYGVSHPDMTEPPGYAMAKATVSVRYSAQNHWVMLKGYATTGPNGVPMGAQYLAHAQNLISRPDFNGVSPCWADGRITSITGGSSPGGRSQWVEINTNRHISLVTQMLP